MYKLNYILTATAVVLLAITGCDNTQTGQDTEPMTDEESQEIQALEEFKQDAEEIAKYFASNTNKIDLSQAQLESIKDHSKLITDVSFKTPIHIPTAQRKPEILNSKYYSSHEDRTYKLDLEIYKNSNTTNPSEIIFAADPDRFYPHQTVFPGFRYDPNSESGFVETQVDITVPQRDKVQIPRLLFFIGTEEIKENLVNFDNSTGKLNKSTSPQAVTYPYLCLTMVDLITEGDVGNDEFELYVATGTDPNDFEYPGYTMWLFNGSTVMDAMGHSVKLPDVNHEEEYHVSAENPGGYSYVALSRLYSYSTGGQQVYILPIEDDDRAGVKSQFAWQDNRDCQNVVTYRNYTNLIYTSLQACIDSPENSWGDEDDWYNSQFREFTSDAMGYRGYNGLSNQLDVTVGGVRLRLTTMWQ